MIKNQYICGECGKSFDEWVTANNHVMAHSTAESSGQSSLTTFKCDQCVHAYLRSDELRNHKVTVHSKYGCIYVCNGCDYQTSHITIFWAHKLKVHGDGPLEEKNISYGNLFFNVLASQQENLNEEIIKMKLENKEEVQRKFRIFS